MAEPSAGHILFAVLDPLDASKTTVFCKRVDELQEALEPATKVNRMLLPVSSAPGANAKKPASKGVYQRSRSQLREDWMWG